MIIRLVAWRVGALRCACILFPRSAILVFTVRIVLKRKTLKTPSVGRRRCLRAEAKRQFHHQGAAGDGRDLLNSGACLPGSETETRMHGNRSRTPSFRSRPAVAIVGATGAVGRELLRVLEDRIFPFSADVALDHGKTPYWATFNAQTRPGLLAPVLEWNSEALTDQFVATR